MQNNRIALITGAHHGVGLQGARALAADGPTGTFTRWDDANVPW